MMEDGKRHRTSNIQHRTPNIEGKGGLTEANGGNEEKRVETRAHFQARKVRGASEVSRRNAVKRNVSRNTYHAIWQSNVLRLVLRT